MNAETLANKLPKFFTIVIIIIGVLLSLYQFFFNRSIWNDEATLCLNIIHRSPANLLKPLDFNQVAPILFLQIEHCFLYLIPDSEFGLRLFPLLTYFASIYLFYRILTLLIKNKLAIALTLALFVSNSVIIYYSSEVKQYMTDVFVGLLLYFFLFKHYKSDMNKYLILGVVGSLSIFLSNASLIILFTIFIYLITISYREKVTPYLLMVFFAWGISFVSYYYFFISNHPSKSYMISYWSNEKAFMPINPFKGDFYKFLSAKFNMIFFFLFSYGYAGKIFLPLIWFLGLLSLYTSNKKIYIVLLVIPMIVHLLLSAFKLYPFGMRLLLYQYPILLIGVGLGIDLLIDLSKKRFGSISVKINNTLALALSVYVGSFIYCNGFPILHTEIKESLKYVEKRAKNDEAIFVYEDLVPAFWFYRDINYIKLKNNITFSSYSSNVNDYFTELIQLKGKVWLLLDDEGTNGAQLIINKLNEAKCRKLDAFKYGNASAYLYDLSTLKQ